MSLQIRESSRPCLPLHILLQRDAARDRWVIQAPERILLPDETAIAILQLADGVRSVAGIVDQLAERYLAPREVIAADVLALLQGLADQGFLTESAAP